MYICYNNLFRTPYSVFRAHVDILTVRLMGTSASRDSVRSRHPIGANRTLRSSLIRRQLTVCRSRCLHLAFGVFSQNTPWMFQIFFPATSLTALLLRVVLTISRSSGFYRKSRGFSGGCSHNHRVGLSFQISRGFSTRFRRVSETTRRLSPLLPVSKHEVQN